MSYSTTDWYRFLEASAINSTCNFCQHQETLRLTDAMKAEIRTALRRRIQ
jgi:hypothetical protein